MYINELKNTVQDSNITICQKKHIPLSPVYLQGRG